MEENVTTPEQTPEVTSTRDFNIWDAPTTTNTVNEEETPQNTPDAPATTESTIDTPKAEPHAAPVVPAAVPSTPPETTAAQEKVIEKIIEKLPEFKDENSRQLYQAISEGKETEVYEYLSKKFKDYDLMSDADAIREGLKLQNPKWTDKDIDVELRVKYGRLQAKKDLDTIEIGTQAYEDAEAFNEKIEEQELIQSRDARDFRILLNDNKKTIELPKLDATPAPEKQLTQEEIDEFNRKWDAKVEAEMPQLSDFKMNVNGEEVLYKISDEDRATQTAYMKDFSADKLVQDLGWINEDGSENISKIAGDVLRLKNFEKIMSSIGTQLKVSATKDVVADIKKVDLNPQTTAPEMAQDVGKIIWS